MTLFSLSAFFTRASSKEIFGEENASPVALRYYALALLNKAINIQPNLVLQEKLADYQSRLAGDSCSNELYIDMSLIARDLTEENTYIAPVWNAYVPSAWRYGRDLTRQA